MAKEYIERDVALNAMMKAQQERTWSMDDADVIQQMETNVEELPAAEVRPIETAYWDWQVDGTHFCSECGNDAPLRYVDEYCSNYCPHCGRLMTHVETPNNTGIGEYECDE